MLCCTSTELKTLCLHVESLLGGYLKLIMQLWIQFNIFNCNLTCILFLNILEHVQHHGEGVEHVPSVQHVDMVTNQNVNVHDVAFLGKKNACYVVLVLNYRLVTVKKRKRVCQFIPFICSCNKAPFSAAASYSSKEKEPS